MEKQQNLIDPSLMNPQSHLSTFGVLKESIKTTRRNGKLAMFILLLVFISFSQLELSSRLAFKRILKDIYSQQQRAYPSSYNGYTGQTKQVGERKGYYSYQLAYLSKYSGYTGKGKKLDYNHTCFYNKRVYPSSYNGNPGQVKQVGWTKVYVPCLFKYPNSDDGYTSQTKQVDERKGYHSYQRAYPRSYNGYTGQTKQVAPMGYNRYTSQTKQASKHNGAYSYQRTNPTSYGYMGQTMPMGNQHRAYSYHQSYPRSYGNLGEAMGKVVLKDFWVILGLNLLILVISCIILLFFLVAIIYSSYEAYTAKVISLKDVHLKFKESWKRVVHTGICLALLSLGVLAIFALLTFFAYCSNVGGAVGSLIYVIYTILIVLGTFWYFHMAALWMISLVVSVLESDFSGHKAIRRAGELMNGKMGQAYLLILLFNLAMAGVNMISCAYIGKFDQWAIGIMIPFTVGLICVFKLLMFVAFTIYYHERKMNQKEEKVDGQLGLYVPIASDEV